MTWARDLLTSYTAQDPDPPLSVSDAVEGGRWGEKSDEPAVSTASLPYLRRALLCAVVGG